MTVMNDIIAKESAESGLHFHAAIDKLQRSVKGNGFIGMAKLGNGQETVHHEEQGPLGVDSGLEHPGNEGIFIRADQVQPSLSRQGVIEPGNPSFRRIPAGIILTGKESFK